jgi:hypothetical protein
MMALLTRLPAGSCSDGVIACADAKCRLEASAINPKMIKHALEKPRKQNLPKDKPGHRFRQGAAVMAPICRN